MAAPSPVMGLSLGGNRESSRRRLPPLSQSVPAQPSSSEVGESSDDVDYHQLLKDYYEVQVVMLVTMLNAEMLRGELDALRNVLQASMTEFSKVRVD